MSEPTGNLEAVLTRSIQAMEGLIANSIVSRSDYISKMLDPRRDLDHDCGYPKEPIPSTYYLELYERDPIANRVVEVVPLECWEVQPVIYETDESTTTPFEADWAALSRGLLHEGVESYYQDDEGSPILEVLERADVQSGVGRYGLLLFGLDDGLDLELAAVPRAGQKLTFLQCFSEGLATVSQVDMDPKSPRYNMPTMYQITLADPNSAPGEVTAIDQSRIKQVHWTRVQHIVDNIRTNRVYGDPRMHPVLPRVLDLRKLYGSSAEMFYQGGFPGYAFETIPQLGGNVKVDEQKTKDMFEKWRNTLSRLLILKGMTARSLSPQVSDPLNQINTQLDAICIKLAIPKRVFLGSERGELASSQDERAWDKRKKRRRNSYVTPRILVPFVNRLIWFGCLSKPKGYSVFWPDSMSATEDEKVDLANKKVTALTSFIKGNGTQGMTWLDFWTKFMDVDQEEAQQIVDDAEAGQEVQFDVQPQVGGGSLDRLYSGGGNGAVYPGVSEPETGEEGQLGR